MRGAAFFDLNGTLTAVDAGPAMRELARRKRRRWRDWLFIAAHLPHIAAHRAGWLSHDAFVRLWVGHYARHLAGLSTDGLRQLADDVWRRSLAPVLRRDVVAILERRQQEGLPTVLVTALYEPLAAAVGRELGFDHIIATPIELRDGRTTGLLNGPVVTGTEKTRRVRKLLATDAAGVELSASHAYADSGTDSDLLLLVGHPAAVHPDTELANLAHRLGWPIIGPAA